MEKITINIQYFGGRGANFYSQRDIQKIFGEEGGVKGKIKDFKDFDKYEGKSLQEVEDMIKDEKIEYLMFVDKDNKVYNGYKGNATMVGFMAKDLNDNGVIATHNHPKTSVGGFGGTLSWQDMKNFLSSKWKEHRAVATGQGEKTYSIKKKTGANGKGLARQMVKDRSKLESQMTKSYTDTFNKFKNQGIKKATFVARQKSVGIMNRYWKDMSKKYGFTYTAKH